jgi:hypothetical protein
MANAAAKMRKFGRMNWISTGGMLLLCAVAFADEVPVIGLTTGGQESVRAIPQETFFKIIEQAVTATHESVLPELACTTVKGPWRLNSVAVGIGVSATLGLGPIFSIQATPKIFLIYSPLESPIFPVQ